jgi:osmoprotectant transport system substrate-binding protein
LLAELFAQSLERTGIEVERRFGLGPREIVFPSLELGHVDFVPEYAGSALTFASLGRAGPSNSSSQTHRILQNVLSERGVRALTPAPAENQNGFAVTAQTARELGFTRVSDLAPVASSLSFGGPPECGDRPYCLPGLQRVYGIDFGRVVPLDAGGPATVAALDGGQIEVGLLFTTNPAVDRSDILLLRDDRHLQPAENITPIVRDEIVSRLGDDLRRAAAMVTRRLTTSALRHLNGLLLDDLSNLETLAGTWLNGDL